MDQYNGEHTYEEHHQDMGNPQPEEVPTEMPQNSPDDKDVRSAPEAAVDATLRAARAHILKDDGSHVLRKAVAVSAGDRKKVRRRFVDTDVSVSDLVFTGVVDLLEAGAEVTASDRKRPSNITIAAPEWWWLLLKMYADSHNAHVSDVVAKAIGDHLP